MRKSEVSSTLTVYHDGQFWVGVVEHVEGGTLLFDGPVFLFLMGAHAKKRASSCAAGKLRSAVHAHDQPLLGHFGEIAAKWSCSIRAGNRRSS